MTHPRQLVAAISATPESWPYPLEHLSHGEWHPHVDAISAVVALELARPTELDELGPLFDLAASAAPIVQVFAIRALGRVGGLSGAACAEALLQAGHPAIRAEAANALAQMARDGEGALPHEFQKALGNRLLLEQDPEARGALLEAMGAAGCLHSMSPVLHAVLAVLDEDPFSELERIGALLGLMTLLRSGLHLEADMAEAVRGKLLMQCKAQFPARLRILAMAVFLLTTDGGLPVPPSTMQDAEPQVRRLAVLLLEMNRRAEMLSSCTTSLTETQLAMLLRDRSAMVRWEALLVTSRFPRSQAAAHVLQALSDEDIHVRELAIESVSRVIANASSTARRMIVNTLRRMVERAASLNVTSSARRTVMRDAAVALAPLATLDPGFAREHILSWIGAASPQLRACAARGAEILGSTALLEVLGGDAEPNVASIALQGLVRIGVAKHEVIFLRALLRPEHQVIVAAAEGLARFGSQECTDAILTALERLTSTGQDNTRDARVALLEALEACGYNDGTEHIASYLNDFDPWIAKKAAKLLKRTTGTTFSATPRPRLAQAPPMRSTLALVHARLVITMQDDREIELELYPFEAPATVQRMVDLSEEKYFDGLTFHRVSPNWVVQGGSPLAHELVGASPFMPDELSRRHHVRGTVGISTRGRDTGDAQFFINLCDNDVLNHAYTVWAGVVSGMEVVDAIIPGDAMRSVRLRWGPAFRRNKEDGIGRPLERSSIDSAVQVQHAPSQREPSHAETV